MPRPEPVTIATLPSSCPMSPRLLAVIAADHTRSVRPWPWIAALGRIADHEHPRGGPRARRRGGGDRRPDASDVALPGRDPRGARAAPGVARPPLPRRGGAAAAERPHLRGPDARP